ncbi:hypothetical protein AB2B41_19020 [Marimonas sp. MJW-29]|uniref:Defence against restriction A N-terminal domain-containing protein n=1 Tax=Sulfitobacter sediminis TaxID=3234186 RepID=A0ABV3RRW5_9RHOB
MAYAPIKPEDLKKLIKMAKNRPMNFAFNPGSKGDDLLIVDKIQAPEKIARIAKKEGPENKVASGTFEIEGRELTVKAAQTLPEFGKKFRKHLKLIGFTFGVTVYDADGSLIESHQPEDVEDAAQADIRTTEAPPGNQPAETAREPDQRTAVAERLRGLQGPISALGAEGATLKKAVALVIGLLKQGDVDKATRALARVEEGLAKAQAAGAERAPDNTSAAPPGAPDQKALVARAGAVKKTLEQLQGASAEGVKKDLVQALALLKSQDYAGAEVRLAAAEEALNAQAAPIAEDDLNDQQAESAAAALPEDEDDQENAAAQTVAEWEAVVGPLQAEVDAAMVAGHGDLDAINRAFGFAISQAEAGNHASALKAAESARALLTEAAGTAQNARVSEAEAALPDNAVAYRKSRQDWINTRNGLYADLVKLQMVITAKAREIGGLEDIAQNASVLVEYLDDLDNSLEDTLNRLLETPDGLEREALKKEAITIITNYRGTLDDEFFRAVDQNGFTDTRIRGRALDALSGVETALAA